LKDQAEKTQAKYTLDLQVKDEKIKKHKKEM
jgi:hypothetical protein